MNLLKKSKNEHGFVDVGMLIMVVALVGMCYFLYTSISDMGKEFEYQGIVEINDIAEDKFILHLANDETRVCYVKSTMSTSKEEQIAFLKSLGKKSKIQIKGIPDSDGNSIRDVHIIEGGSVGNK